MNWLRLYVRILDNEDLYALPVAARWTWIELLAAISERDGVPISARSLAFRTRSRLSTLKLNIDRLVTAGMVVQEKGKLAPRNWDRFQYKSDDSSARMRRHRERTSDVTRSPPEQSRTETDSVPSERAQAPSLSFKNAERALFEATDKEKVARLIDLARSLGIDRSGHAASIIRDFGVNKTLVDAVVDSVRYAKGDPWVYMREVLANAGNAADQRRATSTRWPQEDRATPPSERVLTAAEARDLIRSGQAHGAQGNEASAVQGAGTGDGDGASP